MPGMIEVLLQTETKEELCCLLAQKCSSWANQELKHRCSAASQGELQQGMGQWNFPTQPRGSREGKHQ